jgi:Zn-dependent protease with chaperone function
MAVVSFTAACAVVSATASPAAAQVATPGYTAAEIGTAVVSAEIARYGRVSDAAWDREISMVLSKIAPATGYPGLAVRYVVVGNRDVNAAAIPGGFIIINAGLVRILDTLALSQGSSIAARQSLRSAYLAAVLSHEIAHITLGHTDTLAARVSHFATSIGAQATSGDSALALQRVVEDSAPTLEDLAQSRERELAADQVGALYMLRAGWSIQVPMNLMRAFDSLERADPRFFATVTYVRSHPRASSREAMLESFRARLKLLQADYDDALSLIAANVALPTAISLLDTMVTYFPHMAPALHARGTAYHQLWLNTVPVPAQQLRASLTTYAFRFLPLIRGSLGDMTLYKSARDNYLAALQTDPLPKTLAQQGLLDAYAGDCASAESRTAQAIVGDTASSSVANDRGVVLYLCGKLPGALWAFQRADKLAAGMSAAAVFNLASALQRNGDARANEVFRRYLSLDAESEWSALARAALGESGGAKSASTPNAALATPPTVQGMAFGTLLSAVTKRWGMPTTSTGDSVVILTYADRGVRLAVHKTRGVVAVGLLTRDAGSIAGLRVGDSQQRAYSLLGEPAERHDASDVFVGEAIALLVLHQGGEINMIVAVRRQ